MKKIILGLIALSSISGFAASIYDCNGGSFEPVKVEVKSISKIIINDKDIVKADTTDLADTSKKSIALIGNFSTLGDGAEGYSVEVNATRYLFNNSKTAYLNTYNRGPEGFYADSYKCIKR